MRSSVASTQVHRGAPDEAADEEVDGPVVELLRRRDLLQLALAHDRDAVAHRHRLDLVVRDVDRRDAELATGCRLISARVCTRSLASRFESGSSMRKALRLADDRAAHRHALALAARERAGLLASGARRGRGCARPPRRACRSPPSASCAPSGRTRCCRRPTGAGRARSSGRPWRCRGPSAGTWFTTRSPMRTVPSEISSRPATMRSAVDLPQPEGPTSTMNSPSAISSVMSLTALVPSA